MTTLLRVLIILFTTTLLAEDITTTSLKEGQYQFLNKLYRQIKNQKGNIIISPYSIHTALSMAYMGAGGVTSSEFEKVLGITKSPAVQSEIKEVYSELNKQDTKVSLSIANAFFTQDGYKFLESYEDSIKDIYTETKIDFRLLGPSTSKFYRLSQTCPALPLLRKEPILSGFSIFVLMLVA